MPMCQVERNAQHWLPKTMLLAVIACTTVSSAADYYPGWPVAIPSGSNGRFGRLVVGDFGGGPEKEIVCIRGNQLFQFTHTGVPVPGWPVQLGASVFSGDNLLLGNVSLSNPGMEFIVEDNSPDTFRVFNAEGTQVGPPIEEGSDLWYGNTAFLADLDGNGDDEILILDMEVIDGEGEILAYEEDGSLVAGFPLPIPALEFGMQPGLAAAADLDFDGCAELAFTASWGILGTGDVPFVVVRSDGSLLPGFPFWPDGGNTVGHPVFADLDGNSNAKAEIIGSGSETLDGLRFDGSIHWQPMFIQGSTYADLIIANFDLDPRLEVAFAEDFLRVFDPDTATITGLFDPSYQISLSHRPTAGDINGNGVDELVMLTAGDGSSVGTYLHVIDPITMTNLPGWPHFFGPIWGETPEYATLEDMDLNGDLEIIVILGDMIHVLDPPNPGAPVHRASWPTWRGNYARNRDYHYDKPPYPHFTRGDANRDDQVDLGDVIRIGQILFFGHSTKCPLAIDVNGDSSGNIADMVSLVSYLFLAGAEPVAPFPDCEPLPRTPECMIFACP